jgi:hypothetical protein
VALTVSSADGVNGPPTAMTVTITGFRVNSYIGKVTLNNKPYVWFPYVGYWSPP